MEISRRFGGAGMRREHRGSGGPPLSAPVNTVAPVLVWNPTIGNSPTITPGTWTGFPAATFLYALQRDGVDVSGQTGRTLAQANAYAAVAADDGPTLRWVETGTNTVGSATANSNAITFLPETHIANMVTVLETRTGRGLANTGTTFTSWTDQSATGAVFTAGSYTAPAVIVSDSDFNSQRSLNFTAATPTGLVSSAAASVYNHLCNGTGGAWLTKIFHTTSGRGTVWDTADGGNDPGAMFETWTDDRLRYLSTTVAVNALSTQATGPVITTAGQTNVSGRYLNGGTPEYSLVTDGVVGDSGSDSGTPPTAGTHTLRIGRRVNSTAVPFDGKMVAFLSATRFVTTNELASLEAYLDFWY